MKKLRSEENFSNSEKNANHFVVTHNYEMKEYLTNFLDKEKCEKGMYIVVGMKNKNVGEKL